MEVSFGKKRLKNGEAASKDGVTIDYAPQRRIFPVVRWYLVMLLVLSPLIFFAYSLLSSWIVLESPAVVYLERVSITMPMDGFIEAMSADMAEEVSIGQPLIRVLPATWRDDARSLKILKEWSRNFDAYAPPETVSVPPPGVSREVLRAAAEVLDHRHRNKLAVEELLKKGAATAAEYNEALLQESAARSALAQLRPVSYAPAAPPAENQTLILQRRQADTEISLLEEKLRGEVVVSPIKGRVSGILGNAGSTLPLGTTVLEMVNDDRVRVLVYADGEVLDRVFSKSPIEVMFPGNLRVMCVLANMPIQTGSLPSGLNSAFSSNRAVLAQLTPLDPLPPEYLVDGLAVKVNWGVRAPGVTAGFESIRRLFASWGDD